MHTSRKLPSALARCFSPRRLTWLGLWLPLAAGSVAASAATPPATADGRLVVLNALKAELQRSKEKLALPDEPGAYFIRYLVRDYDEQDLGARFGALIEDSRQQARHAAVEVRVGSYGFDNTADDGADRAFDMDDFEKYDPPIVAPLENDIEAIRGSLWLQTDARYKQALSALHKKRGKRVSEVVEDATLPSFSKEAATKHVDPVLAPAWNHDAWVKRLKTASAQFRKDPKIFDSTIKLSVSHQTRTIVTTEGTELVNERLIYGLHVMATSRADDGLLLNHSKSFYGANERELPDDAALEKSVEGLMREIAALRSAPMLDPYNGPAILLPEAAGVFFHEALGHRLEGERQNSNSEGATFKGQVGKPILPGFISVLDDPTVAQVGTVSLNGHYGFDDEGVASQSLVLVDKGVLRDYLKSRTPVKDSLKSNGHGRSEGTADPIGRMANTMVRSTKQVPYAKLKEMLLAEIKRQKKDFGLIIADITGGQTNTTTYDFQAFKGMPRIVYKVDAKTGKETLVRGVEFVGTPIGSLNRIVAAGDKAGVFNGFCGAESGYVPVSTVAPALLISEIELQRTRRALERAPILPAPWAAGSTK
ncbi:MAG: TldD/PmbA family protein [Deltaproteobacteria bacterium]|nr:TldD/PmbA family protein [Deltaproteobacteria bacterium]